MDSSFVLSPEGQRVETTHSVPSSSSSPRALLVVSHGMAEHQRRYHDFAQRAAQRGFAVTLFDQLGHGETSRQPNAQLGHFADKKGAAQVVAVLDEVIKQAQARVPTAPLVVVAHSMGTIIAQAWLVENSQRAAGCVLIGAQGYAGPLGFLMPLLAKLEAWRIGWRTPSERITRLVFGGFNKPFAPNRTDFDWLSRDEAQVNAYVSDPLCGNAHTPRFWADLVVLLRSIEKKSNRAKIRKDLPLYFVNGRRDAANAMGRAIDKLAADLRTNFALSDVQVKMWEGARHEVLNETNRIEVMDDIFNWVEKKGAGLR